MLIYLLSWFKLNYNSREVVLRNTVRVRAARDMEYTTQGKTGVKISNTFL